MASSDCDTTKALASSPEGLKHDSLAASVLMLFALTAVQRLIGFLRGILFCRWLDPEQLGQWDMAIGFLMLAAPLAVLGLPGSFGRYVEHYRERGQLRPFLRSTGMAILLLTALAVAAVTVGRVWLSELIFGTPDNVGLVLLMAAGLGVVIVDNAFGSLYTALRQVKFVSLTQFVNSAIFAAVGIGLVLAWSAQTAAVVIAFVAASCATATMSMLRWRRLWTTVPAAETALPNRSLWAKLAPFAFWLWVTNWLSNAFGLVDRFMIVHYGGLPAAEALNLVGQYHTARIFPVLMVGVTEMLATVITPHLSADWDQGRRAEVSRRLCLILKGLSLGLVATALAVLVIAPLLFHGVWQERFADGLLVLPWALICAVWTGLAAVSYNYLWYAEKSRFIVAALAVGLVLNVSMTLPLLPGLGLLGAALATAAARLAVLCLVWWFAWRHGMHIDRGLIVAAVLPLAICLGPWSGLVLVAVVALGTVPHVEYFNADEKKALAAGGKAFWAKLKLLKSAPRPAPIAR
jgi:O-antigen/teichoic acid export membrane protein